MRIFGPFACPTTSAFTVTDPSASYVAVTASPSTSRSAGRVTRDPGSSPSELTVTTSPTATLYCLPPLRTIAYTRGLLSWSCSGRASPRTRGNGHVARAEGPAYEPASGWVKPPGRAGHPSSGGAATVASLAGSSLAGSSLAGFPEPRDARGRRGREHALSARTFSAASPSAL